LLAHETDGAGEDATTAAGRMYDKLHAHLAPLVGDAGVQVLFVRSAKLTRGEFARFTEAPILDGATKLRECLHARDPAVTAESATLLFGTFFALITTFIGERLTTQVLRRAWPILDETAPGETSK
jgi:hypothetical protein